MESCTSKSILDQVVRPCKSEDEAWDDEGKGSCGKEDDELHDQNQCLDEIKENEEISLKEFEDPESKITEVKRVYRFKYFDEIEYEPDTTGTSLYSRVFIYRDYSEGIMRFSEQIPPVLRDNMFVTESAWKNTVDGINEICLEAEKGGWPSFRENLLYCLTCYFIVICRKSNCKKCMDRLSLFIKDQNRKVYDVLGLRILDPALNGYRYLEVLVKYLVWRTTMPVLHWGKDYPTDPQLEPWELDEEI